MIITIYICCDSDFVPGLISILLFHMVVYDKLSQNKDRYIYKTLDQGKH